MLDITIILTAFLLVFLAELGDKTQLVAFSLTTSTKNPLVIFLSTSLALVTSAIISSLIGGLSSKLLPQIASILSAILFLIFGFYMLLAKEPPAIKSCFLKALSLENYTHSLLPKFFKKISYYDYNIANIVRQEKSHAEIFTLLLKEKTLFNDDINEDDNIEKLTESLVPAKNILKLPVNEAFDTLIKSEEAALNIYTFIFNHLHDNKHSEVDLKELMKLLINEEREHIKIFKEAKERVLNG